jgi:hypothetical protein
MNKILFYVSVAFLLLACEKNADKVNLDLTADIVGFDMNCSTCILEFPDDYAQVRKEIGNSPDNFYNAINLNRNDFNIGQKLKVKIRKAEIDEFKPCITLYPTYNYASVVVTEFDNFNKLIFNDTIELSFRDCLYDQEDSIYICLDSVLSDSRCPTGVNCFWEGNAEVRFKFEKYNENPVMFNLNTHRGFANEMIIDGYKFSLVGLSPYPVYEHPIKPEDYEAEIIVTREHRIP